MRYSNRLLIVAMILLTLLAMLALLGTMDVEKIRVIFDGLIGLCKAIPFEKIVELLIRYYEHQKGSVFLFN